MPPISGNSQPRYPGCRRAGVSHYHAGAALFIGLLAGSAIPLLLPEWWLGAAFGAGLAILILMIGWGGIPVELLWGVCLGCLCSGAAGWAWVSERLPPACIRTAVSLTGDVASFPVLVERLDGTRGQRFQLSVSTIDPPDCQGPQQLQLSYWQPTPRVTLGDRLTLEARLRPPLSQWNQGGIPDQVRVASGIDAQGTATVLQRVPRNHSAPVETLRQQVVNRIDKLGITPRVRGVLLALTVGYGGAIEGDDWQRFQDLGLAHILVISGLHVGLVFGLLWQVGLYIRRLIPSGAFGFYRGPKVVALTGAGIYTALAGFSLPTQRAMIMLVCVTLPALLGWRSQPRRGLWIAVAFIVLADTFALLSRGFWMSVAATAVVLTMAVRVRDKPALRAVLEVQLALTVILAPVTLLWFHQVSWIGVLSNMVFVPIIALVVVPLALLGTAMAALGIGWEGLPWELAAGVLGVLLPMLDSLHTNTETLGVWRYPLTLGQTAGVVLLMGLTTVIWRRSRRAGVAVAGFGILLLGILWQRPLAPAELTVFDVGQGLAVLWREDEHYLLFDTGAGVPGGFSQADKVIRPYLQQRGVERLNTVMVSHPDSDHSGGLSSLEQTFAIEHQLGFGGDPCQPGMQLAWPGQSRLIVLNGSGRDLSERNQNSCVLLIEYGDHRILLTGDIPLKRERELVRYWRQVLQADVLVVAHHGSHTSTGWTFLKWVRPTLAVVSAGRANPFGHPAPPVMERLRAMGAAITQTALDGAVRLQFDDRGSSKLSTMRDGLIPYWLRVD